MFPHMNVWSSDVLWIDDGLEAGTAEQLGISLAKASPEVKQCVASCKHIAEAARQQSNFQNVGFYIDTHAHLLANLTIQNHVKTRIKHAEYNTFCYLWSLTFS